MFRAPHYTAGEPGTGFSAWDEKGIPTLDDKGEALAKKRRKNLEKEYERQVKLHEEYLAAKAAGEV